MMTMWIILIVLVLLFTWMGYKAGVDERKDILYIKEHPHVLPNTDTLEQAKSISCAIKKRANVLKNSCLLKEEKIEGKRFSGFAMDNRGPGNNKRTTALLEGNCINLIRFVRTCHAYGVHVTLRQIGMKDNFKIDKNKEIYISKPNFKIFLKEEQV